MKFVLVVASLLLASSGLVGQDNAAAAKAIEGTWVYAEDPTGKVKSEPIYEGSTITFEPGGRYAFALADTPKPLAGTWELRGAEGNIIRVHTEYGENRRNDLTLTVRRDARGSVAGFEVREGDVNSSGVRYYVPRKK